VNDDDVESPGGLKPRGGANGRQGVGEFGHCNRRETEMT
jgi:hypothetical protein